MAQADLSIRGMTCAHCVASVTRALEGLPGVREARVQLGGARVRYDDAQVRPEDLVATVVAEGYQAELAVA